MLDYTVLVHCGGDFDNPVEGIKNPISGYSVVSKEIFLGKDFWRPVNSLIENEIKITDLSLRDFESIMSQFGDFKTEPYRNKHILNFNKNNQFDLSTCYFEKDRIDFGFIHCPLRSAYLIQKSNNIDILIDTYNKSYFYISESEWYEFINYLNQKLSISESRDKRISDVLGSIDKNSNLLRHLKFSISKERNSDRFLSSVLSFYEKTGFITDKQANAVSKILWD